MPELVSATTIEQRDGTFAACPSGRSPHTQGLCPKWNTMHEDIDRTETAGPGPFASSEELLAWHGEEVTLSDLVGDLRSERD